MSQANGLSLTVALVATLLSGCVEREIFDAVPGVADNGNAAGKDWPDLVPASLFEGRAASNRRVAKESAEKALALEGRVARLKRRAAALRGPILSRGERRKLDAALR